MVVVSINTAQAGAGKTTFDRVEVNAERAFQIGFCEVKVKVNLCSIGAINAEAWA